MDAKYDREVAPAAEYGSGPSWERCLLCGSDLELDWPDLTQLKPSNIRNHAHDEWRQAAAGGCKFCKIIIAVIDDAGEQYRCSVPDSYDQLLDTGNPPGDSVKGFQVSLRRNESTGRYLLALEHIWMPLFAHFDESDESDEQDHFWGKIIVYLDGPDVFNLNLEPFHEIPRHSGSAEALKYARDWLTTCQNEHPDCCPVPKDDGDPSASSQATIRILQICDDELILKSLELCGETPPYVALSHCWGSSPTLKTLSTNIDSFRVGIQVRDLPSTFKDAVELTKLLGFYYIWIDSLCIVQDNLTDWEEQSSLMASVYGNAELVIAASSASSTEDGFLKQRKRYRESSLRISCVQNKDSVLDLRYRLLTPKDLKPMVDPLDRRAWAFQERLLARRYLAIGSYDTSWTCTTALACECEWWRVASIWRREVENIERLLRDTADEEMARCWREKILEHYAGRDLTVPSDNLVAISAIASIFRDKLGPEYYAGIWQQDIIPGLLWAALGDATRSPDRSTPSWSWASLQTLRFAPIGRPSGVSKSKELARVLEIKTTASTVDPFGSVNSGFIKLWGEVWRAEILTSKPTIESPDVRVSVLGLLDDPVLKVKGYLENTFRLYFDTPLIMMDVCLADGAKERSMRRIRGGEVQEEFYIGNLQEGETIPLLMVPLVKKEYQDRNDYKDVIVGLILGRSCEQCTKYERVGRFRTFNLTAVDSQALHGNSADNLCEQEIEII